MKEIQKKQLQIFWDYAKQLNNIHCKLYLQFFVICFTSGLSFMIAVFTGILDITFLIGTIILFIFTIHYIFKIRSLPDELNKPLKDVIDGLEKLKGLE